MNLDVQWCAHMCIKEGILTPELCCQISDLFDEQCDLHTFAQTIIDNDLYHDMDRIQEIMDEAFLFAKSNEAPPTDPFDYSVIEEKIALEESQHGISSLANVVASVSGHVSWEALPDLDTAANISHDAVREMMATLLISTQMLQVSDLHLSAGYQPFARWRLQIRKFGKKNLSAEVSEKLNTALLTREQKNTFLETGDADVALALSEKNRFRINLMKHNDGISGTYRMIPNTIQTLDDLGFPNSEVIYKMLDFHNGLILVTGPVGSGKTTTLASLVDAINQKRYDHIITVEDPIEIVHQSKNCNVTQREVGIHTDSFASALKAALREDPDIIVIGELRDLETIEMAITASETGHLVIGTLHTNDAAGTLSRLLDVFPPGQQQQIRSMIAESLRGIICQRLLIANDDRIAVATEILVNTFASGSSIRDNKLHQIKQIIETGMKKGMCTMDQSIFSLFDKDIISEDTAISQISDPSYINRIKGKKLSSLSSATSSEVKATKKPTRKGFFR